jgi:WXXGXW repeat (2 copies)
VSRALARRTGALAIAFACAGATIGCVANETTTPARGVSVSGPPPAPLTEERPPAPSAQAAWVAGYWHWTGVHYAWIPGHWEQAPAGATWAGPRYVSRDGAYFYEPGAWQHAQTPQNQRANAIR